MTYGGNETQQYMRVTYTAARSVVGFISLEMSFTFQNLKKNSIIPLRTLFHITLEEENIHLKNKISGSALKAEMLCLCELSTLLCLLTFLLWKSFFL